VLKSSAFRQPTPEQCAKCIAGQLIDAALIEEAMATGRKLERNCLKTGGKVQWPCLECIENALLQTAQIEKEEAELRIGTTKKNQPSNPTENH